MTRATGARPLFTSFLAVVACGSCEKAPLGGGNTAPSLHTPTYAVTQVACSLKPDAAHMPVVKVEPTDEHPVPYSLDTEEPDNYLDQVGIAARTAELLEELGAPLEVDEGTFSKEKSLIGAALKHQDKNALKSFPAAMAASAFIKNYGHNLAHDVMEVRAALTNKLLEIANCGETKFELRALELLGKHSDIGLFTERSEITVNYNSPDALEAAIKEKVKRLLNAEVIDMPTAPQDLNDELGVYIPEEEPSEEEEADGGEA